MAIERNRNRSKASLSGLKGDYANIAFLLLLYILQGIPIGLSSAVPLLLQNRKVSYSEQALFSFVTWPFSLKLLWAPIVDSLYWRRLGRRKSWLIPIQLGIGIFMMLLSRSAQNLINDDPTTGERPDVFLITLVFLMLNFLAATQDIAVDGWALTMLSRRNVGYASTCNTAGQTAGFFIGNVIFLALESADFCNKYIRSVPKPQGIVTFENFLHYNGLVFLIVTILVAVFKSESSEKSNMLRADRESDPEASVRLARRKKSDSKSLVQDDCEPEDDIQEKELSVRETYFLLYKIMKLNSFRVFAVILLTIKIGFSAPDAVSGLKLIEAGVHKENLALLAVPMVPLQIFLPWFISRITCGPRPLDLMIKAYPYRLVFGLIFPAIVYWTPSVKLADGTFPFYYYMVLTIVYAFHQVTVYSIYVALMAFHASISDPSIGGTYMTLLNTISNLGGNWPSTTSLWLVEKLTLQDCTRSCKDLSSNSSMTNQESNMVCDDICKTKLDGYYIECAVCVIFGILWFKWGINKLRRLQTLPPVAWSVIDNKSM